MAKKKTTKKKTAKKSTTKKSKAKSSSSSTGSVNGKKLVIVESPAKAKTINKYLGADYVVRASVGHIRDLPSKNPKGVKQPVPGVDLEKRFQPSYEVLSGKNKTVAELRKLAKSASEVWFATDKDREGEAIAWHLAELLKISPGDAKRVVFNAITKKDIQEAFANPTTIDMDKVDAQQARRILDRIVGYQVSPLLWKKVARGLSAGRVQSVAVRLIVDREREIRAHIPDEYWEVTGRFALDPADAAKLAKAWPDFMVPKKDERTGREKLPTIKQQTAWLAEHRGLRAELIEVGGEKFAIGQKGRLGKDEDPASGKPLIGAEPSDLTDQVTAVARLLGLTDLEISTDEDATAKGPARVKRTVRGSIDVNTPYRVKSVETKPTSSRPRAPFITSTLQQAASSFLGFNARRTMQTAQKLYEGISLPGEGETGLITYMRTDSTYIAGGAIAQVRDYIEEKFGDKYLPEKPNFYSSSNKGAQEAHEAIRPTSVLHHPDKIKSALTSDQYRLYKLIWERFVACQMTPAKFNSTTVLIEGGTDPNSPCTFRTSGRVLVFDGFTRVSGLPSSDDQTLPDLKEEDPLAPFSMEPEQKFTPAPSRFTEAGLIKALESEGIGRPSTYASIISVIQDRKYVELIDRSFYATDLGEVVTDKLVEAFSYLMELSYTREMEEALDEIETEHRDWQDTLELFYGRFKKHLDEADDKLSHAKAEITPAPKEFRCQKCGADTVYRFGKNGRFLSCSRYPDCNWACPVDREGRPLPAEYVNIRCPKTGRPMIRKNGRFGPFVTTYFPDDADEETRKSGMILNIDKKGYVNAPSPPPLETDLPCPKCEAPLYLREGVRGPWLGCSKFPKCRARGKWAELDEDKQKALEKKLQDLLDENPIPVIKTLDGRPLTDEKGKPLPEVPKVEELLIDDPSRFENAA